jgi:hypothetical protein
MENKLKHKFGSEFFSMNKFIEKENYIFSKKLILNNSDIYNYNNL